MSQPYIGEIRMVGFNFQVNGWNFCNGATISIAENSTLFTLIGTTYGGDGQQTFQLPDLQGRIAIHQGSGFVIGQKSGSETVTLTTNQIPSHTHTPNANSAQGTGDSPASAVWAAASGGLTPYQITPTDATMNPASIGFTGGNQPHDNMPPYLVINYIISLYGVFPSQN